MIVDRYDPMNLFEQLVPKLKVGFEPELAQLDRLLDDDVFFERVKADLCRRYPNSARLGRHSTPVEVILRMLVVKGSTTSATNRLSTSSPIRSSCGSSVGSTWSPSRTTPPSSVGRTRSVPRRWRP
jgi:hypothetical protein